MKKTRAQSQCLESSDDDFKTRLATSYSLISSSCKHCEISAACRMHQRPSAHGGESKEDRAKGRLEEHTYDTRKAHDDAGPMRPRR